MKGLQLVARRAILATLKASPLTALVKADQMHGQTPLVSLGSPFIKLGRPQTLPIQAACLDGADINIPLSAFARSRKQGNATVEYAEYHAGRIGAAIERALDRKGFDLTHEGQPVRVIFRIGDMLLQQDGAEADTYHYACTVRCRLYAE